MALSGGADSMALLHLCLEAAKEFGLEVAAAHLDHALREESAEDAEFVARQCERLGVPLSLERVDVRSWARERGLGLEAAGRSLRYAFFERVAAQLDCQQVVLGHHLQDQAETVLHRMVRGSGGAGVAAMRARRGMFIRPLLSFSREELREFLENCGGGYREDASNADQRFSRNFIRHQILPRLRELNPSVDGALCRLAESAAVEDDFWRVHVERLCEMLRHPRGGCSLPGLLGLHEAERRRVLLRLLQDLGGGQISQAHVAAVMTMLAGRSPQEEISLPGGRVVKRYGRIEVLSTETVSPLSGELLVRGYGHYDLPGGGTLRVGEESEGGEESRWSVVFPAFEVQFPLSVRSFRPGDRLALERGEGHKKLKKLYGELRLETEVRMRLPLLLMGDEVLWIPGVRRSGAYRYEPGMKRGVRISLEKPECIESLLVKSGCLC